MTPDYTELIRALEGMLIEWDKFSRYGSPIAKAANERVNFAREVLDKWKDHDKRK